jgi:hypothetical protein
MPYTNITNATVRPFRKYVEENWVQSDETTFLKKQVFARGAHLALVPASFITSAADAIIGLGAAIGTVCTVGKHQPTYKFAMTHLYNLDKLFVNPYVNFLRAVNPEALFSAGRKSTAAINANGDGFLTGLMIDKLKDAARTYYNSDNFLKRHVASRLTYALLAVACLVTRAVDAVIGILAATFSILTFGKFESLNNMSYRALQFPGILTDLFYCTIKFINPWTGTSKA